jgi:hypothetical protein
MAPVVTPEKNLAIKNVSKDELANVNAQVAAKDASPAWIKSFRPKWSERYPNSKEKTAEATE